jgi:TPR repeat protein
MFDFLRQKAIPSDLSQVKTEHIARLLRKEGQAKATEILQRAAIAGSTDSAVFLSVALGQLIEKNARAVPKGVLDQFVYFTEMAAHRGDNGSRFNLAKHYMQDCTGDDGQMSVEGYENLKKAEFWHKQAAAEGFAPSVKALNNLTPMFEWADGAFESGDQSAEGEEGLDFLRESIDKNGWVSAVSIVSRMVIAKIPSKEVAYQFLLEELDGASRGNEYAQQAAKRSGIPPQAYRGALERSRPEVDGPGGPQQLLLGFCLQLADDQELMAKFRCDVGREVQEHFELGIVG